MNSNRQMETAGLVERIHKDLIRAMKRRDPLETSVLRMMKTALTNRAIEKKSELSDTEAHQVLKTLLKQRSESIEQFEAGGRSDLAEKERRERAVIETYLPEAVSAKEMEETASAVIEETGATGPKDLGRVMSQTMARLESTGKTVDGKAVNALVRAKLERLC